MTVLKRESVLKSVERGICNTKKVKWIETQNKPGKKLNNHASLVHSFRIVYSFGQGGATRGPSRCR